MGATGLNEVLVAWSNGRKILRDDALLGSSALDNIAFETTDEPEIGGRVNKHFEVELVAQFGVPQHENSLDNDDAGRLYNINDVGSVVDGVVVRRNRRWAPVEQFVEVFVEQIPIERLRVVVIRCSALFHRLFGP